MRGFVLALVVGALAFVAGDVYGVKRGYLPRLETILAPSLTLEEQADRALESNPAISTLVDCSVLRTRDGGSERYRYFLVRTNGIWQVKVVHRNQPLGVFEVKQDAENLAVAIARASCPSRLDIQNLDSDFIEVRLYG